MSGYDESIREPLVRLILVPGWAILTLVTVVFALGASLPLRYQFVPLIGSVVVIGLPHGAVDHLTPTQARNESPTVRSLVSVGALYAVAGGAYGVLWFLAPVPALAIFITLTWFHWGQGEVHALLAIADVSHLKTRGQRAMTALGRGAVTMFVPLVAFPEQYQFVVEHLVGLFVTPTLGPFDSLFTPTGRFVVGCLVGGLLVLTLAIGFLRADEMHGWMLDAGETGLLVACFSVVPPVLAVGLYFTVWHSLRHVGRLLALDPVARAALSDSAVGRALGRFARTATPLTIGAVLVFGVLYLLVPATPGDITDLVALYLVVIAMLTLPHVLIVTDLDREQAVWSVQPSR